MIGEMSVKNVSVMKNDRLRKQVRFGNRLDG